MVSIIIPCFNQGVFLIDCLESLRKSTFRNFEVIIINDGSTEIQTNEIISKVQDNFSDLKILIKSQSNLGLSRARNEGIKLSQGKFIQLLDSDDMIHPKKLEMQLDIFSSHPEKQCVISNYIFVHQNGQIEVTTPQTISGHKLDVIDFLINWEKNLSIPIHCALFKRSIFDHNYFPSAFKAKEDWIFWTCISEKIGSDGFLYHPEKYALYRLNSFSMTKNRPDTMLLEWVKARTFLMAQFGSRLTPSQILECMESDAEHIRSNYILPIQQQAARAHGHNIRNRFIEKLQNFPLIYKSIRSVYRCFKA